VLHHVSDLFPVVVFCVSCVASISWSRWSGPVVGPVVRSLSLCGYDVVYLGFFVGACVGLATEKRSDVVKRDAVCRGNEPLGMGPTKDDEVELRTSRERNLDRRERRSTTQRISKGLRMDFLSLGPAISNVPKADLADLSLRNSEASLFGIMATTAIGAPVRFSAKTRSRDAFRYIRITDRRTVTLVYPLARHWAVSRSWRPSSRHQSLSRPHGTLRGTNGCRGSAQQSLTAPFILSSTPSFDSRRKYRSTRSTHRVRNPQDMVHNTNEYNTSPTLLLDILRALRTTSGQDTPGMEDHTERTLRRAG
jgi:hypothetical protein